ncbi:MAG: hypothetical protein U0271_30300 [Polyangiaceae bacterium]
MARAIRRTWLVGALFIAGSGCTAESASPVRDARYAAATTPTTAWAAPTARVAPTVAPASATLAPSTASQSSPPVNSTPAVSAQPRPIASEEPTVEESGTMSEPERVVLRATGLCLEAGVERGERASGDLSIQLFVDPQGEVSNMELGAGYPASVRACVIERIKAVRFPVQPGGGLRAVRYSVDGAVSVED